MASRMRDAILPYRSGTSRLFSQYLLLPKGLAEDEKLSSSSLQLVLVLEVEEMLGAGGANTLLELLKLPPLTLELTLNSLISWCMMLA